MKNVVFILSLFLIFVNIPTFAADNAKQEVTTLIHELKASTDVGLPNLQPILEQHLDFTEISHKVLLGIKKLLNKEIGREKSKELISAKFADFEEKFKIYAIKKYASAESINKFKTVILDESKTKVQEKGKAKFNVKTVLKDNNTEWNVSFDVSAKSNKITEFTFEGGISLFVTEKDLITEEYKKQTGATPEEKLQGVIDSL
jgi:hypothetical protein